VFTYVVAVLTRQLFTSRGRLKHDLEGLTQCGAVNIKTLINPCQTIFKHSGMLPLVQGLFQHVKLMYI